MPVAISVFVDTNVLLYCISSGESAKQQMAMDWVRYLWQADAGRISWQVIHEYNANAPRKAGRTQAREFAEDLLQWHPLPPSAAVLRRAWHWCDTAQLNFWDAMILAAAENSNCRYLLSEDFQTGRQFGEVTIVNPFRERPEQYFARQAD